MDNRQHVIIDLITALDRQMKYMAQMVLSRRDGDLSSDEFNALADVALYGTDRVVKEAMASFEKAVQDDFKKAKEKRDFYAEEAEDSGPAAAGGGPPVPRTRTCNGPVYKTEPGPAKAGE